MSIKNFVKVGVLASTFAFGMNAAAEIDPNLPNYQRASGVSGNFTSIGSDTLNNLMTLWAEDFAKFYPNVNIQIQGAGSSTAPPAIIQGASQFGPMSRAMKQEEIEEFVDAYGYEPYALPVAIDMLAVYVNKDNPIESMTLPQVDAVFSATRRGGYDSNITRWGDLDLSGDWGNRDITVYGRNSVSGTYGYFKENALYGGDFKPSVNEQPGSSSVVQGVTESINGIGYSGIGYITSGVRAVPLAKDANSPAYGATADEANDYPLSRFLYVYINKAPNQQLDPMQAEFVRMVFSKQGQQTVQRDGYLPISNRIAERVKADLGLN